jgi:hypothetical protein
MAQGILSSQDLKLGYRLQKIQEFNLIPFDE